jgi:NAD-dependent oxidoreductase involved in siderophore biosynthesis
MAYVPKARSKYRMYSQTAMTNAYLAAKTDMSIRRAAQQYGVPFQTLRDRIAGDIDLAC